MLAQAIEFTIKKHEGQFRMGGEPYSNHPIEVMNLLSRKGITDERYLMTALFHDLLEDTDATEQEILSLGGNEVLHGVKLLTKEKGYNIKEYVQTLSENEMTKLVKLADRLHNLLSAVVANKKFQLRYIDETKELYTPLSKGTIFEEDIKGALNALIQLAHS